MQKIYILALLLFLKPAFVFAQSNFKPGYVVPVKGDTLRGYVDYREWNNTPLKILFKPNTLTAPANGFTVDNTLAFGIEKLESYDRFTVPVSRQKASLTDPVPEIDTIKYWRTVFLKILVKGNNVTLYQYDDEVKTHYYIAENGNNPDELNYWVYQDEGVKQHRRYRIQLSILAQKYKPNDLGVERVISVADYEAESFIDITQRLNDTNITAIFTDNSVTDFFAGAGVNYGLASYNGLNDYNMDNPQPSNGPMPFVTIGFNHFLNKSTRKLYFGADLSFLTNHNNVTNTYVGSSGTSTVTTTSTLDYKQYTASLSPQMGYNFYSTPTFKFFGNIGIAFNFSQYSHATYTNYINGSSTPSVRSADLYLPKFKLSTNFKAGFTIKQKIDVFAGVNSATFLFSNRGAKNYQLGMHYRFSK